MRLESWDCRNGGGSGRGGGWFPWGRIKTCPSYQRGGVWEEQELWVEPASGPLNSESAQSSVGGPPGFQTCSRQCLAGGRHSEPRDQQYQGLEGGMNWAGSSGWRGEKERVKYPDPVPSSRAPKKPSRPKGAGKSCSHYFLMLAPEALRGVHQSLVTGPT